MELVVTGLIISSGLFAGGVVTIAWDRLPLWKDMPATIFQADFARTVRVADTLQPILLVVAIITAILFGMQTEGMAQILAWVAAGGYILILGLSLAVLVPLQKRLLTVQRSDLEARQRWLTGHIGRTVLTLVSFVASASAVALW